MKISKLDRFIGWLSPKAGTRRLLLKRAYEAAQTYSTSDWIGATSTSANAEVGAGRTQLQLKSRDLARNNPYAVRALNVIVNNTVGAGIVANIKGKDGRPNEELTKLWKQVAETSLCDVERRHNFYGLQALAMRSMVESGESLALKRLSVEAPSIQILEADFIVSEADQPPYVQGIKVDALGKRVSYRIYKQHPGERTTANGEYNEVNADQLFHLYRQERPGQLRGVAWSHPVIEPLKDFADFQNATLIARKVSACFVGFVETNGNEPLLDATDLKAKREAELQMNPGTFKFLNPGEKMSFSSPPSMDSYSEFVRESMRAVAAGYGVSYEAMTGDYSQVNFSSGRMGHLEFRRNIDHWRWNILIPQFCEPYFKYFLDYAKIKGLNVDGVTVEWVPPAHVMIDPTKEVSAEKEAVLAGFKSRSQVIRESGNDPEAVRKEIQTEREADLAAGLKFDTDAGSVSASKAEGKTEDAEKNDEDAAGSGNKGGGKPDKS